MTTVIILRGSGWKLAEFAGQVCILTACLVVGR